MYYMFYSSAFNHPSINLWDVRKVTVFDSMFGANRDFNQSLNSWVFGTTNPISMGEMFSFATAFNGNISSWNTIRVINMFGMFDRAYNFNQPIGGWNTSNVTNMRAMFISATSFNQPIGGWNTSNVTTMYVMFSGASSFNQDLTSWSIASLTDATSMFNQSGLSSDNYNKLLVGWAAQAPSIQSGVPLGALTTSAGLTTGIYYTTISARNARDVLTNTYGWTITDGGFN
jgi:surface protein